MVRNDFFYFVRVREYEDRKYWQKYIKANRYNGIQLIAIITYESEFKTLSFVVIRAVLI